MFGDLLYLHTSQFERLNCAINNFIRLTSERKYIITEEDFLFINPVSAEVKNATNVAV